MTIASGGLEERNKIIRHSLTPIDVVYVLAIMPKFGRKASGKVRYGSFRLEYSRSLLESGRSDRNSLYHFD